MHTCAGYAQTHVQTHTETYIHRYTWRHTYTCKHRHKRDMQRDMNTETRPGYRHESNLQETQGPGWVGIVVGFSAGNQNLPKYSHLRAHAADSASAPSNPPTPFSALLCVPGADPRDFPTGLPWPAGPAALGGVPWEAAGEDTQVSAGPAGIPGVWLSP